MFLEISDIKVQNVHTKKGIFCSSSKAWTSSPESAKALAKLEISQELFQGPFAPRTPNDFFKSSELTWQKKQTKNLAEGLNVPPKKLGT